MTKPQTTVYINKVSLADLEWRINLSHRIWLAGEQTGSTFAYEQEAFDLYENHPERLLAVKLAPYREKIAKAQKAHKKSEPAQKELTEVVNASLKWVVSHG